MLWTTTWSCDCCGRPSDRKGCGRRSSEVVDLAEPAASRPVFEVVLEDGLTRFARVARAAGDADVRSAAASVLADIRLDVAAVALLPHLDDTDRRRVPVAHLAADRSRGRSTLAQVEPPVARCWRVSRGRLSWSSGCCARLTWRGGAESSTCCAWGTPHAGPDTEPGRVDHQRRPSAIAWSTKRSISRA